MQTMTNERVERFKTEAAELNLKAGSASRDTQLQILGVVLMVVGIVVSLLLYSSSLSTDDARDIQSNIIFAIGMLGLTVLGGALFLRYSISKFLRLWLLRQSYESQSHIDQIVEAVKRS